jgi:class 3 adenylate cyclase
VDWSDLGVSGLLPTGMATLLLADIEGSTRLWEAQPEEMTAAVARFEQTVSELVAACGGVRPQPPPIPRDTDITCPDIAGINYVRDANDSRAFYLCVDGEQKHHFRCPQLTLLNHGDAAQVPSHRSLVWVPRSSIRVRILTPCGQLVAFV